MRNELRQKKIILSLVIAICFLAVVNTQIFAFDLSFRPKGFVSFPMGEGNIARDGNERYGIGGGGDIGLEIDLSTIWSNPLGLGYTFGIEGGMLINPLLGGGDTIVSFYSFGAAAGLYYFPLSRLLLRFDGAVGTYQSVNNNNVSSPFGLFFRGGGEVGFRFTPSFTIAANAGWRQYQSSSGEALNSGMYAGMTAQITVQAGRRSGEGVSATLNQYGAVYPAFMQIYQSNPIGNVTLRNNENAEIRNVRMFFRASGYTASDFPCGTVSIIPRGRSVELPMFADFSPDILRFTDTGRIMGEIVIRYNFLGQEREVIRAVTVAVHDRNRVTIGDAFAMAAFISPTSSETLDFARFIAGLERSNRRVGHNQNMQYAILLLEGLRASNIRLGETYAAEGEAQFPAETLLFRTGSSRDLALLFASCLEGVGIKSAFIQTDDDFLVAVSLEITSDAAETLFNGVDRILIINNNVWLPLSMAALNDGFSASWAKGVTLLNEAFSTGMIVEFVMVEEAWSVYPPAPLPELGRNVIRTNNTEVDREVNRVIQLYIDQEINAIIRQVQAQISARPTAALHNRLGILLVRAGRINEGKASYERAAGMGSIPAMVNRGNLALTERDFTTAERWFRQVLQQDRENEAALRGLERIEGNR
ncbi:MAG: hypothetical protein FWD13_02685 [Treponema sp.]|nr:hypothetical protein [Treponema sp.]